MVDLSYISGRYWWCLEHKPDICRLARFKQSGNSLVLSASFSGTLAACRQFMIQNQGAMDGVLVADDSIPIRLLSGADFTLQSSDMSAPFLPGIAWADLQVVPGISPEEPVVLCHQKSHETLLEGLVSQGFCISRVVPVSWLQALMLKASATIPVEAYVQKSDRFRDIWIYHVGEFKGHYRICGNDSSLGTFFQEFLPRRYPGAEPPTIKDVDFSFPGISTEFAILAVLARETFEQGIEHSPSLGNRNDEIARERRTDASVLRKIAKVSATCSVVAVALLIFSWLIAAGYGLYTRSDRSEYVKRMELDKELQSMSQQLDQQRDAMVDLLRHRTRHVSKMSVLIQSLPANLWLTRWEIQGNRYTFQGLAENGEAISSLLSSLEKSPLFRQVRLRTTEKTTWQGRSVVHFDMTAEERE